MLLLPRDIGDYFERFYRFIVVFICRALFNLTLDDVVKFLMFWMNNFIIINFYINDVKYIEDLINL